MFASIRVTINCGDGSGTTLISDTDDLIEAIQEALVVADAICD